MAYGLIVFASTHTAMAAEKKLKDAFPILLMPTPRQISAACGISLRFSAADREGICAVLGEELCAACSFYCMDAHGQVVLG